MPLPLRFGDGFVTEARVFTFDGLVDGREHVALGLGDRAVAGPAAPRSPLVRLHSECLTGDVLGSQRCDCGPQLREAVERIADGRRLPALPASGGARASGSTTSSTPTRSRTPGSTPTRPTSRSGSARTSATTRSPPQMLLALGVDRVDLLTNNPDKVAQLRGRDRGRRVLPTGLHLSPANARYLAAKAGHGHHDLDGAGDAR